MREIHFTVDLDKFGYDRLRIRLLTEKGALLDVVYQYESFLNGEWVAIVRYDCSHGFFHRDVMLPNGDKEKYEVVIDGLKNASRYAEQDLRDRWEWYKDRYLKKIKK